MVKLNRKENTKQNNNKKFNIDYLLILVFLLSIFLPIQIASTQSYITSYGDDIAVIDWAREHHENLLDIFFNPTGTGYRPMTFIWGIIMYDVFGTDPVYYYLFNGLLFSGAMIFLYLLGKTLHSRTAGFIAILLYLFLDASFITVSKFNFYVFSGEIFFITSALYYSINYYKTDNKTSMYLGIILSGLAFLSKEPSLLIIPTVNLMYLWYNGKLSKKLVYVLSIPFIYLFILLFYIAPGIGAGGESDLMTRFWMNLQFYIDDEIIYQFKSPFLIIPALLIAIYYVITNKLKPELMMCLAWIVVGVFPLLITQLPGQPTYLIETNLGMVLLIGIIISERVKKNSLLTGLLILGILFQLLVVPMQISNMKVYNSQISANQITYFETIESLKTLPQNATVFYFNNSVREKHGMMQLDTYFFTRYLYLRNIYNLKVSDSFYNSEYIVLPSSSDVQIFQKEFPTERVTVVNQFNNSGNYGFVLRR